MKQLIALIAIIIACAVPVALPQQFNRRQQAQNCITPENYYGTCVVLSFCPQIANLFLNGNQQGARQYAFALQRSCGTRNINGDPVVCCTQPLSNVRPQPPVTRAPNPFLPTSAPFVVDPTQRNTRNPQNPFFPTTAAPKTRRPAVTTTAAPVTTRAPQPVTSAPQIDDRATNCRDPRLQQGVCKSLETCEDLVAELYAKPNDAVFANYLRASNAACGGTGSTICCPSKSVPTTTSRPIFNSNEIPRRLPTLEENCGITTITLKKIVGGEPAPKGAWPWIALLGYDDELSSSPFKCGGTLVTARHVVTAAHCIRSDLSFVRLGEHDLSTNTEAKHVDIKISRQEAHPEYNRRNGRSDIAILYLERNVQFSDFIAPICMPSTPELRQKSYAKVAPFVVGWGKTMEGGNSANILQQLQITTFSNQVCKDAYKAQNRVFSDDQFDAATVCAGVLAGGKDTCQGDSGGPLMAPETYPSIGRRFYLIGIVSYGIGCARPGIPGVYTSTQYFMDWILQKIADTP